MSITALLCKVTLGVGALNVYPGIVESPRYGETVLTIKFQQGAPVDVWADGPLDGGRRYTEQGLKVSASAVAGGWLIDATGDAVREHLIIDATGRLLWTSASYAVGLNAASVSLYTGHCEAE